jgi:O-antigen/teichoic acid export membrane protein
MLSELRPVSDVGSYGAAWRLLEFALILPQSLCLSLYPRMAGVARCDPNALNALGQTAMRYLFAASLPLAVGTTILAEPVLTLFYGEPFRTAGLTLTVLMWTLVPYAWVRYHAYVLVAAELQRIDMLLNVAMSAVNIGLNLVLIPAHGPLGAAIATLASVAVYGVTQYGYLRRHVPGYRAPVAAQQGVPLAAAAAMGVCVWLVRGQGAVAGVALGGGVYLTALAAMGFFTASELRVLRLDRRFSWVALAAKRK